MAVHRRRNATLTVPHRIITSDHGDHYRFRQRRSTIDVLAAPGNHSYNLRVLFWGRDAKRSIDQESCVTWTTPDGRAQPGMALRIDPGPGDVSPRALIVTQNLWGGARWNFWLLEATGSGNDPAGDPIALIDMYSSVFGGKGAYLSGPWRVCARVIGTKFSLKVWALGTPEPPWSSPRVRHETLPADWDVAGYPGAYIGHIRPGKSFTFTDLESRRPGAK